MYVMVGHHQPLMVAPDDVFDFVLLRKDFQKRIGSLPSKTNRF